MIGLSTICSLRFPEQANPGQRKSDLCIKEDGVRDNLG